MDKPLAIVTGAASGIGRAIASRLSRRMSVLAADVQSIDGRSDADVQSIVLDVTKDDSWEELRRVVHARGQPLTALVHSAGTALIKPAKETSAEEFRRILEINLVSVFLGTVALWEELVDARGSVVCLGSVAAVVGQDASASYVASKGGLVSLSRALAIELAPHGVRFNVVSPGPVITPLLERHFSSIDRGDEARSNLIRRMPLGRLLEPDDIAPLVDFLCTDESRAITGAHYIVDGGLTATFDYGTTFAGGGTA